MWITLLSIYIIKIYHLSSQPTCELNQISRFWTALWNNHLFCVSGSDSSFACCDCFYGFNNNGGYNGGYITGDLDAFYLYKYNDDNCGDYDTSVTLYGYQYGNSAHIQTRIKSTHDSNGYKGVLGYCSAVDPGDGNHSPLYEHYHSGSTTYYYSFTTSQGSGWTKKGFLCYVRNTPRPTTHPTTTAQPTEQPTAQPTTRPTAQTAQPTAQPTDAICQYPTCTTSLPLDIGILIDESGSISDSEYVILIDFIKRLINYDINDDSYLSLFRYADSQDFKQFLDFTLLDTDGRKDVLDALNNHIRDKDSGTKTGYAIQQTLSLFPTDNVRSDVLFVLTDGESDDDVCKSNAGVEIIIIGIGEDLDLSVLQSEYNCLYVDDACNNNIFYVPQFTEQDLIEIEYELRLKSCREPTCTESAGINKTAPMNYVLLTVCVLSIMTTILLLYRQTYTKNIVKYEKVIKEIDFDSC